jgi:hypothetical protein
MRRRAAPALLVVIQSRQVVVDERERVDELECRRRGQRLVRIASGGLGGSQAEDRIRLPPPPSA